MHPRNPFAPSGALKLSKTSHTMATEWNDHDDIDDSILLSIAITNENGKENIHKPNFPFRMICLSDNTRMQSTFISDKANTLGFSKF